MLMFFPAIAVALSARIFTSLLPIAKVFAPSKLTPEEPSTEELAFLTVFVLPPPINPWFPSMLFFSHPMIIEVSCVLRFQIPPTTDPDEFMLDDDCHPWLSSNKREVE